MRVEQNAQRAVLDFATFRMWKDLRDNWKTFTQNRVVNHLINTPYETFVDDVPAFTGEPLCPIACDESQMLAVKSALEGRSFVLEGPPGTGKSQTIANLISAAMAEGKKVLFVAEKQAALNAVSKKLDAIGLSPFCITMHHESTTTESISQQLKVSLHSERQTIDTETL
jgi:primosomal protein N'